jgi:hypothetical protein
MEVELRQDFLVLFVFSDLGAVVDFLHFIDKLFSFLDCFSLVFDLGLEIHQDVPELWPHFDFSDFNEDSKHNVFEGAASFEIVLHHLFGEFSVVQLRRNCDNVVEGVPLVFAQQGSVVNHHDFLDFRSVFLEGFELLEWVFQDLAKGFASDVDLTVVFHEKGSEIDDRALVESIEHEVVSFEKGEDLEFSELEDHHRVTPGMLLDDDLSFVVVHSLHVVDQLVEAAVGQDLIEVEDLLQNWSHEGLEWILMHIQIDFEVFQVDWVLVYDFTPSWI